MESVQKKIKLNFNNPSPDIWKMIASFLDFRGLITVRSICQNARKKTIITSIPYNIRISDAIIKSIPALVNLTTLYASGNSGITDVSALVNLTTLYASDNSGIRDVSALVNLTTLYVCGNSGIRDVSALVNLTTLYVCGNSGIRDVSALVNLTTLERFGVVLALAYNMAKTGMFDWRGALEYYIKDRNGPDLQDYQLMKVLQNFGKSSNVF